MPCTRSHNPGFGLGFYGVFLYKIMGSAPLHLLLMVLASGVGCIRSNCVKPALARKNSVKQSHPSKLQPYKFSAFRASVDKNSACRSMEFRLDDFDVTEFRFAVPSGLVSATMRNTDRGIQEWKSMVCLPFIALIACPVLKSRKHLH